MENQNRRKWLLATVLALLGAATLCVWGVAAAGIRFSSPPLEAAIQAFNETRSQSDQPGSSNGGDVNISVPGGNGNGGDNGDGDNGDGNGNGDGGNGSNGNGGSGNGGADGSGCLLGLLCLDADVNVGSASAGGLNVDVDANTKNGINVDADVNTGTERCFLGLLCINSNTDASLNPFVRVDSNTAVQLNTGPAPILAADVDADLGNRALLDADVNVAAGGNSPTQPNSWLNNLLSLFVNIN